MTIKHFLLDWIIPPELYQFYGFFLRTLRNSYSFHLMRSNKPDFSSVLPLKGIHQGERCFILGTGPSLGKMDLTRLKGEKIIAIHDAWLHPDFKTIQPQYHMIAPYHTPFTFKDVKKRLLGMKNTFTWPVKLFSGFTFYPYSVHNYLLQNPEDQFCEVYPINYTDGIALTESNHLNPKIWDISKRPFLPMTGNMEALQIALYLGFTEIVFLGIDHTFAIEFSSKGNQHFYEKGVGQEDDEQHRLEYNREYLYLRFHQLWRYYRLIDDFAVSKNIKLYNATPGSELDVLERIDLSFYLSNNSK